MVLIVIVLLMCLQYDSDCSFYLVAATLLALGQRFCCLLSRVLAPVHLLCHHSQGVNSTLLFRLLSFHPLLQHGDERLLGVYVAHDSLACGQLLPHSRLKRVQLLVSSCRELQHMCTCSPLVHQLKPTLLTVRLSNPGLPLLEL